MDLTNVNPITFFESKSCCVTRVFICHYLAILQFLPIRLDAFLRQKVTVDFRIHSAATIMNYIIHKA